MKEAHHEILRFVNGQNSLGINPSFTAISKHLGISKPTTRKRIKSLVYHGYLILSVKGRTKVVELTNKGRNAI